MPKSYTPDGLEELGEGICSHLEIKSQVGVYPREIEELEERIEAGGWDLCIGKDSDQARFKSFKNCFHQVDQAAHLRKDKDSLQWMRCDMDTVKCDSHYVNTPN